MSKYSIKYNPNLTIKENAQKNGCSEDAIRYYIKTHSIDRRAEQAAKTYADGLNTAMDSRVKSLETWHENFQECSEQDIADLFK